MEFEKTLLEIREQFENLELGNQINLDRLRGRLAMVFRNLPESSSKIVYTDNLSNISFFPNLYSPSLEEKNYFWDLGKNRVINLVDTVLEEQKLFGKHVNSLKSKELKLKTSGKVFIVHGHDSLAKTEVALFLQRLSLEPIVLHEQVNSGKTIIEKIEANTDVGFGVVLYTPCDLGKAKDNETLNQRARQNVVFEHGFLIGKLGRDKVLALVKDSIEYPSDISGVVYEVMDNNNGWHIKLAKELKTVGYDIDLNKAL